MQSFQSGGVPIRLNATEPSLPGRHPAVLLLHGAGGNVGFWLERMAPFAARLGIAIYAVHYFDRTKTVRADQATILDGRHVPLWLETIGDAVEYVKARPGVDADRVALIGISLGAFLSLALATRPDAPGIGAIVEISGGLAEPYAQTLTETFPPTLILHGDQDTIVPVSEARTLDALLTRLKVPHQTTILAGEGHWFSQAAQMQIFLATAGFLGQHLGVSAA